MLQTPNLKSKGRKIYEMPICTICLDPLLKDLAVFTSCGHVFHYNCAINAHTSSRKCPNCRHRSTEVQSLHFLVEEVSGVDEQMHQILCSLAQGEQDKMAQLLLDHEHMISDIQRLRQRNELLEGKSTQLEKQLKDNVEQMNQLEDRRKELESQRKEYSLKNKILEQSCEQFQKQSEEYYEQNQSMKEKLREFEYLKNIKNVLEQNEDDAYIKQIRGKSNGTEQAQLMYDMYVMKNGQCKQLQNDLDQLLKEKESTKKTYDKLKIQYDDLHKENQIYKDYLKKKKHQKEYSNNGSQDNSINPHNNLEFQDKTKNKKRASLEMPQVQQQQKIPAFGTSMIRSQFGTISNSLFRKNK